MRSDFGGAEIGVRAVLAEVRPVRHVLGAPGGARPARIAVRPLDAERPDELLGVVVEAHAFEFLVGGVAAVLVEDLQHLHQVDVRGLRDPHRGNVGREGLRSRARPCRSAGQVRGREAVLGNRAASLSLAVELDELDQRQRCQRTGIRNWRLELLGQHVGRQLQVIGQVLDDVGEDDPPRPDLDVTLADVAPDRRLVRHAGGRNDLPREDRAHQRQHRERAPVAARLHVDAADIGYRVPAARVAALACGNVVDVDRGDAAVGPGGASVVAQIEADMLEGPRRAQVAVVSEGQLDLDGGLEPAALGAERHAGQTLVGRVALLLQLCREADLGDRAEVVGVRGEKRTEFPALTAHLLLTVTL